MQTASPSQKTPRRQGKAHNRRGRSTTQTASRKPPAPAATTSARMRYRFDSAMSRGPFVVIAYLAALSVPILVFAALVAVLFGMAFAGGTDDGPDRKSVGAGKRG